MAGRIINISERRTFTWKAVPISSTSAGLVVVQQTVPVWSYREVSLLIRVHADITGQTGATVKVYVHSSAPTQEDTTSVFPTSAAIATATIAETAAGGNMVKLDVSPQSSTPVNAGAYLLIAVDATGGSGVVGDVIAVLSIDLVGKE